MESLLLNTSSSPEPATENQETPAAHPKVLERASDFGCRRLSRTGPRPPPEPGQLSCPRCHSTNTKFCYYNNYNLSQPRHFCRSCRRYWTRGGALRNVPVGGGNRKPVSSSNKRPRTTATASSTKRCDLVSLSGDHCGSGRAQTLDPGLGSGPKEANTGTSVSCFWSNGEMGSSGGVFPFNGYGLGHGPGLGYEQTVLDWPVEQVSGGDGGDLVVSGESPGCGTWLLDGGDDGGGLIEGDYFSWPDLAISTPAKALK